MDSSANLGHAQYVSIDLCHKAQVLKALERVEVVFHMAAPSLSINSYQLHYSFNVQRTENVVEAGIELKVERLIYTSSPSVVFKGFTKSLVGKSHCLIQIIIMIYIRLQRLGKRAL